MESDEEDIDIQDLDIEDEPPLPRQPITQHHAISGLSMVFKANRSEPESTQAFAGSSTQDRTASSSSGHRNLRPEAVEYEPSNSMRHTKRKSDDTQTASSSGASSIHMGRHGRSSSSSSNNSDNSRDRSHSYLPLEDRFSTSFSPTQRPIYMSGTSPLGTSPSFDSYLSRRRSLGHQSGNSSYSPGSSPTYSSFAAYHGRAATAPSNMGGNSPAFGASSPPNLPLHAHLHQTHVTSAEDVIAHLNHSPHARADITPCPPPDADEPWIDLPPSVDAALQSPTRGPSPSSWHASKSPVIGPDVNLERRRSDPSGMPRSPATRPARKANSSPARVPLRLSQSHTGQSGHRLDNTQLRSTSPATLHQRGRSDSATAALRSPHKSPMYVDQSPEALSARRPALHDVETGVPLARQRSHSPSRYGGTLSLSPLELAGSMHRPSPVSGTSPQDARSSFQLPARSSPTAKPASTSPHYSPQPDDLAQSSVELDLLANKRQTSPSAPLQSDGSTPDFFKTNAKLFPPAPNHDLSMPPRSGWDLSDDADVSPLEEKSLEEAEESASFDMDHDSSQEHDQDSAELRPDRSPSSPTIGTIPLPRMDVGEQDKSPEWGAPLDFNRGPAVELETLSPEDHFEPDIEGNDGFNIDMDEEGLTPLERIFLFAKSEHADHRETVSRMLPLWLEEVEVCEAVDYILPLFHGLIEDEDHVKEAFASSLDKLMWYFFSHCPLVELSAQHEIIKMAIDAEHEDRLDDQMRKAYREGTAPNIAVSAGGLQLYKTRATEANVDDMETIRQAFRDAKDTGDTPVSGSTLVEPDSGDTMLGDNPMDHVEVADRPLLPLDTFHSILASLLMNEISTVSAVAQEALVRFVQMLQDDSLKTPESPRQNSENLDAPTNSEEVKRPHVHRHYDLPQRARELIRDDIVDEIVLALFRMDRRPAAYASLWKNQPMRSHDNSSQHEDPSSKFSHFFDDPMASTSPGSADEPDAQQAVFVGLTLVAMLAETNSLPPTLIETRLLPPVLRCAQDPLIVLKKQAVEVFASVSRAVSEEAVTSSIAPTVLDLADDPSPTIRRTVAALLPEVIKKIVPEMSRRSYAINLSDSLATDAVPLVRQAYLEISGPLIYVFEGNVPDELIKHLTGTSELEQPEPVQHKKDSDVFRPLIPAFANADAPDSESHASNDGLGWDVRDDHSRAIITAYNLPGVILSVGESGWPKLKNLHAALALDSTVSQPRYLIASSIHDVASFIGQQQAAADLIPIFQRLAADDDIEVVMRAFERFPEFLAGLPNASTQSMARILLDAWIDKGREDWRLREVLAEGLAALATQIAAATHIDGLLAILKEALYDRITAVRVWAAKAVPSFLQNIQDLSFYHNEVSSMLYSLATQPHHKHRATYCLCLLEVVQAGIEIPSEHWDELANLAEDRVVDVRLVAARCVAKIFETGEPSGRDIPADIVRAALSLKSDSSMSVREELQEVNTEILQKRLLLLEKASYHEQASDSSDDEENAPTYSRSRTADARVTMSQTGSSLPSEGGLSEGRRSPGDPSSQGFSTSNTRPDSGASSNNAEENEQEPDDDDDDDTESLDLDSSTIYEIDLDDLASSTTHLPSKSLAIPHRDSPYETPPSSQRGSGLHTPSRVSSTPPGRPCQTERASSASSWHFSMRDEEQYVNIDVAGHA